MTTKPSLPRADDLPAILNCIKAARQHLVDAEYRLGAANTALCKIEEMVSGQVSLPPEARSMIFEHWPELAALEANVDEL